MGSVFNHEVFAWVVKGAPERTGQTIKQIADRMGGVDQRYLAKMINPHDSSSKLGVEDFVFYMTVTDLHPLDYIERYFNRVPVPIPPVTEASRKDWLLHIGEITRETGEAVSSLAEAVSPDSEGGEEITAEERERVRVQVWEGIQALAGLWKRLED